MPESKSIAAEFVNVLETHAAQYGVELNAESIERLSAYYKLLRVWNPRLHLVAPCTPAEFATRHILESLMALPHLSKGARVVDIGSGAGLPIIPCLIVRPDLNVTLIESSAKKSIFLREALKLAQAQGAAMVINQRFELIDAPAADCVTCRALERFSEKVKEIIEWSPPASTLFFFGGETIRERLEQAAQKFIVEHIPESERRFLFIVQCPA
jgi:16S rRNA (guanine527-N7)-methyltransferase